VALVRSGVNLGPCKDASSRERATTTIDSCLFNLIYYLIIFYGSSSGSGTYDYCRSHITIPPSGFLAANIAKIVESGRCLLCSISGFSANSVALGLLHSFLKV
jgi:hypothetical protein